MTLILGALAGELTAFRRHVSGYWEERWHTVTFARGSLGPSEVVVVCTGVGKTMAALATQHAIDRFAPNRVICTGIAGALRSDLAVGDLVVGIDSLQYDLDARPAGFEVGRVPFSDYRLIPSDPQLVDAALGFGASEFRVVTGRILTGDQVLRRIEKDRFDYLAGALAGDAVEMEGASAGLVALVNDVPFLLLRVISDHLVGGGRARIKRLLPIASERTYSVVRHVLAEVESPP